MNLNNLLQWYEMEGVNLWENCSVPAPIDINNVINNIILKCGLLTPMYGDPDTFKMQTHMWFIANQYNFDHLVKIILADYSPIENVAEWDWYTNHKEGDYSDKHSGTDITGYGKIETHSGTDITGYGKTEHYIDAEEIHELKTETHSGTDTDNISGTDTSLENTEKTVTEGGSTTTNYGGTNTHEVSAYNSGGYQADSKDTQGGSDVVNHGKSETTEQIVNGSKTYSKTDSLTHGEIISENNTTGINKSSDNVLGGSDNLTHGHIISDSGNDSFTHGHNLNNEHEDMEEYNRYRHGNIGVTTNNTLERQELEWLEDFNPYDWIAAKFEREMMLQLY